MICRWNRLKRRMLFLRTNWKQEWRKWERSDLISLGKSRDDADETVFGDISQQRIQGDIFLRRENEMKWKSIDLVRRNDFHPRDETNDERDKKTSLTKSFCWSRLNERGQMSDRLNVSRCSRGWIIVRRRSIRYFICSIRYLNRPTVFLFSVRSDWLLIFSRLSSSLCRIETWIVIRRSNLFEVR